MRSFDFPKQAIASLKRVGIAATLVLGAAAVQAVSISPVLVELSPARRVVSVTFVNSGSEPLRFQSQVMAWSQVGGVDRHQPSDDLIVAPPIADIPAGGTQIFRVALRGPANGHEQAYRLVFEDASEASAPTAGEVALKVRINHDLPVFVAAAGAPKSRLALLPCPGRAACVRVENSGNRYAQVRELIIDRSGSHSTMRVNSRVLAGAWRQWDLPVGSGPARVSLQSADGPVSVAMPASTR